MKKDNKTIIMLVAVIILILVFQIITRYIDNKSYEKIFNDSSYSVKDSYKENEFNSIRFDLGDLLNAYLSDFSKNYINNNEKAFSKLTDKEKKKYKDMKDFVEKMKKRKIDKGISIAKYSTKEDSVNYYYVLDSNNNVYHIFEKGVWNYQIEFTD